MTDKTNVDKSTKKISTASLQKRIMPVVDWIVKVAAGLFFIACTYGYIQSWLKVHQGRVDLSIEGAILTTSVALYLYFRQR